MGEVYIRSYNEYAHKFELKSGTVIVPAIWARPKNIVTITDEQFEELQKCDSFNVLFTAKKGQFVKLNEMPRDALDAQEKLALANDQANEAKAEAEAARAEAQKAKELAERLQKVIDEQGGLDIPLDAKIKDANEERDMAKQDLEAALAEVSALKAKIAKDKK